MTSPSSPDSPSNTSAPVHPRRQLTLFDSTSIIVGIIIGAGIYETTPLIASQLPNLGWLVGVWLLGGLLSLVGALCYAELATSYPQEGGDYVYLTRAFGPTTGFLFAWSQMWVVRPGSIGAMAFIFARYANRLFPLDAILGSEFAALLAYALGSIVVLTAINLLGTMQGKWTQNVLTSVKVIGLAAIVVAGLTVRADAAAAPAPVAALPTLDGFSLAMILVLYTYGGFNEMGYVAAEVRRPEKNILRALVLGTITVTLIYTLVSLAFVHALGYAGTQQSSAVAADVLQLVLGDWAARAISLLICISALGAINGMILTGARIYFALGSDYRMFAWFGRWSSRRETPVWALLFQGLITLALVAPLAALSRHAKGGFQSMVEFTTPIFWLFFLLVGVALFVLRRRVSEGHEPYRVLWYPVTPAVFCLSSLFMLWCSITYAVRHSSHEWFWAAAIMVVGVAVSFVAKATPRN